MFRLFQTRTALVEETSLSHFVLKASAAEKRKVYNRVIRHASEEQQSLIEAAKLKRKSPERATA